MSYECKLVLCIKYENVIQIKTKFPICTCTKLVLLPLKGKESYTVNKWIEMYRWKHALFD